MVRFAINHMTLAQQSFAQLLDSAVALSCCGVEVRNDLAGELFDGLDPAVARQMARDRQLSLLAIAEVARFNVCSDAMLNQTRHLLGIAKTSGAQGVVLIPSNDGDTGTAAAAMAELRTAIRELKPLFAASDLVGFIEPLGFPTSSLRHKADVIDALEAEGARDQFSLIHDTFHHALAGGGPVFPADTGIMHVSGVSDTSVSLEDLTDASRGLVDANDRLDNKGQIKAMIAGGFTGPISMEAFAAEVHGSPNLVAQLRDSFTFINSGLAAKVA